MTYTRALRNPSILETAPNFVSNRADYNLAAGLMSLSEPFPVLLIIREIDGIKLLMVFLGMSAVSIGIGCAVGFSTHNTHLGVGVASGMIGLLAILQFICMCISS